MTREISVLNYPTCLNTQLVESLDFVKEQTQADWLLDSTHNKSEIKQSVCLACLCLHDTLWSCGSLHGGDLFPCTRATWMQENIYVSIICCCFGIIVNWVESGGGNSNKENEINCVANEKWFFFGSYLGLGVTGDSGSTKVQRSHFITTPGNAPNQYKSLDEPIQNLDSKTLRIRGGQWPWSNTEPKIAAESGSTKFDTAIPCATVTTWRLLSVRVRYKTYFSLSHSFKNFVFHFTYMLLFGTGFLVRGSSPVVPVEYVEGRARSRIAVAG